VVEFPSSTNAISVCHVLGGSSAAGLLCWGWGHAKARSRERDCFDAVLLEADRSRSQVTYWDHSDAGVGGVEVHLDWAGMVERQFVVGFVGSMLVVGTLSCVPPPVDTHPSLAYPSHGVIFAAVFGVGLVRDRLES